MLHHSFVASNNKHFSDKEKFRIIVFLFVGCKDEVNGKYFDLKTTNTRRIDFKWFRVIQGIPISRRERESDFTNHFSMLEEQVDSEMAQKGIFSNGVIHENGPKVVHSSVMLLE